MGEVTVHDVVEARERQAGHVRRTMMLSDPRLDDLLGRPIAVKGEHLQRAGSFKFRGIDNHISRLGPGVSRGVLIVSSGNAGHAAALAARVAGVPCTVVMPDRAVGAKVAAIESLGATVVRGGGSSTEMFALGDRLVAETGLSALHAFDNPHVIAGHGSLAMEILEDCPDVGTIVVPASGGGLLAAVAMTVKSLRPEVRVVGVQPAACDSIVRALAHGSPTTVEGPVSTVADALTAQRCGELPFELISRYVDEVVTVDDESILQAMGAAWRCLRIAIEPAAAASIAALRQRRWEGGVEVAVASGGNFDPALLAHVAGAGTAAAWRQIS